MMMKNVRQSHVAYGYLYLMLPASPPFLSYTFVLVAHNRNACSYTEVLKCSCFPHLATSVSLGIAIWVVPDGFGSSMLGKDGRLRHKNVVDGNVNKLDEVSNGTHDDEAHTDGLADLDKLSLVG